MRVQLFVEVHLLSKYRARKWKCTKKEAYKNMNKEKEKVTGEHGPEKLEERREGI